MFPFTCEHHYCRSSLEGCCEIHGENHHAKDARSLSRHLFLVATKLVKRIHLCGDTREDSSNNAWQGKAREYAWLCQTFSHDATDTEFRSPALCREARYTNWRSCSAFPGIWNGGSCVCFCCWSINSYFPDFGKRYGRLTPFFIKNYAFHFLSGDVNLSSPWFAFLYVNFKSSEEEHLDNQIYRTCRVQREKGFLCVDCTAGLVLA